MPVLINFKICDNSKECGGVAACPTGALSWDDKQKTIAIDNTKCMSCDICVSECPVDAIKVAHSDDEYERISQDIEADPRKSSDLFVDRYGADAVHPAFLIKDKEFKIGDLESQKLTMVEFFEDVSIKCLLKSIPIKELVGDADIKFNKLRVEDKTMLDKYGIKELPALLFFKEGELIGKIEGYYDIDKKQELKDKVLSII